MALIFYVNHASLNFLSNLWETPLPHSYVSMCDVLFVYMCPIDKRTQKECIKTHIIAANISL